LNEPGVNWVPWHDQEVLRLQSVQQQLKQDFQGDPSTYAANIQYVVYQNHTVEVKKGAVQGNGPNAQNFLSDAEQRLTNLSGSMPQFPSNTQRPYVILDVKFSNPWNGRMTKGGAPSEATGGQSTRHR
jgi:hypothetical protein